MVLGTRNIGPVPPVQFRPAHFSYKVERLIEMPKIAIARLYINYELDQPEKTALCKLLSTISSFEEVSEEELALLKENIHLIYDYGRGEDIDRRYIIIEEVEKDEVPEKIMEVKNALLAINLKKKELQDVEDKKKAKAEKIKRNKEIKRAKEILEKYKANE